MRRFLDEGCRLLRKRRCRERSLSEPEPSWKTSGDTQGPKTYFLVAQHEPVSLAYVEAASAPGAFSKRVANSRLCHFHGGEERARKHIETEGFNCYQKRKQTQRIAVNTPEPGFSIRENNPLVPTDRPDLTFSIFSRTEAFHSGSLRFLPGKKLSGFSQNLAPGPRQNPALLAARRSYGLTTCL